MDRLPHLEPSNFYHCGLLTGMLMATVFVYEAVNGEEPSNETIDQVMKCILSQTDKVAEQVQKKLDELLD